MELEEFQELAKDAPDPYFGSALHFVNIEEKPDVIQSATVLDLIHMFADALPREQGRTFYWAMCRLSRDEKLVAITKFAHGSENFQIRDRALELQAEKDSTGRQPTEEETQEALEWAKDFQDRHLELFKRLSKS